MFRFCDLRGLSPVAESGSLVEEVPTVSRGMAYGWLGVPRGHWWKGHTTAFRACERLRPFTRMPKKRAWGGNGSSYMAGETFLVKGVLLRATDGASDCKRPVCHQK